MTVRGDRYLQENTLSEQFNQYMKDAIKSKGNQWVAAQIKNYKTSSP